MVNQQAECPALPIAATALSVQKTNNHRKPSASLACSHVRARYPQAGPQSLGASGKAASRCPQGFARIFETFLLDPQ
jgi:hypothetical protein